MSTCYYDHLSIPQRAVARTYDLELQNISNHAKISFMDQHSDVSDKKIEIDVQVFEEVCLESFVQLERKNASIPKNSDFLMKINTVTKGDETLKDQLYALIDLALWVEKVIEFAFVSEERVKYIAQTLQKYHEMYTETQELKASKKFITLKTLYQKIQALRGPRRAPKTGEGEKDKGRKDNKRTKKKTPPAEEGSDSVKHPAAAGDSPVATGTPSTAAGDTPTVAGDPLADAKDTPAVAGAPPAAAGVPSTAVGDPPAAAGDSLVVKESPASGAGPPAVAGRGSGAPAATGRGSGAPATADVSKKRKAGDPWATNIFRPSRIDDEQTLDYERTGDAYDEEKYYVKGTDEIDRFLEANMEKSKKTADGGRKQIKEYEKMTAEERATERMRLFPNVIKRR